MGSRVHLPLLQRMGRLSAQLPPPWGSRVRNLGQLLLNYEDARPTFGRTLLFSMVGRYSRLLLADFGEGQLLVDSRDKDVGLGVFTRGNYERIFMETAISFLRSENPEWLPKGAFLDVGANIGTSTIDALLRFDFPSAVCFEPDASNFDLLQINLILNRLSERSIVHRLALSDHDGSGMLRRSTSNSGDGHFTETERTVGPEDKESVQCSRLDTVMATDGLSPEEIALVWIDAQGYEARILDGASEVVAADVPIVVEYWPEGLKSNGDLERLEQNLADNYRRIIDIRSLQAGEADWLVTPFTLCTLRKYEQSRTFTDLLLLRT